MMEDSDGVQERDRRIDYIFVRADEHGPTLEISNCNLLFDEPLDGVWASDHFGVVAELRVSGRRPSSLNAVRVQPFEIHVADEVLADPDTRLAARRRPTELGSS